MLKFRARLRRAKSNIFDPLSFINQQFIFRPSSRFDINYARKFLLSNAAGRRASLSATEDLSGFSREIQIKWSGCGCGSAEFRIPRIFVLAEEHSPARAKSNRRSVCYRYRVKIDYNRRRGKKNDRASIVGQRKTFESANLVSALMCFRAGFISTEERHLLPLRAECFSTLDFQRNNGARCENVVRTRVRVFARPGIPG